MDPIHSFIISGILNARYKEDMYCIYLVDVVKYKIILKSPIINF